MRTLWILLLICMLTGCDPEDGWFGIVKPRDSELTVSLTVTPVTPVDMAKQVVLVFRGIEFQSESGEIETFEFDAPRATDLLTLQNAQEPLLDGVNLKAGHYRRVHLLARGDSLGQESFVTLPDNPNQYPLLLPDDVQFSVEADFLMPDQGTLDLALSFDLRRGLSNQGSYVLRPAFRVIETKNAGGIRGAVDERLFSRNCNSEGNAVYIFSGKNAPISDMYGTNGIIGDHIVLSTAVRVPAGKKSGRYEAAYLPEGEYTLAFTCQADEDDPQLINDNILFSRPLNIDIKADSITEADFTR